MEETSSFDSPTFIFRLSIWARLRRSSTSAARLPWFRIIEYNNNNDNEAPGRTRSGLADLAHRIKTPSHIWSLQRPTKTYKERAALSFIFSSTRASHRSIDPVADPPWLPRTTNISVDKTATASLKDDKVQETWIRWLALLPFPKDCATKV